MESARKDHKREVSLNARISERIQKHLDFFAACGISGLSDRCRDTRAEFSGQQSQSCDDLQRQELWGDWQWKHEGHCRHPESHQRLRRGWEYGRTDCRE